MNPEPDSSRDDFPNIDGYPPDRELLFFLHDGRLRVQLNRIYGIQEFLSIQDGSVESRGLVQTPCQEILTNEASKLAVPYLCGVKKHSYYTIECSLKSSVNRLPTSFRNLLSSYGLLPSWCTVSTMHLRISETDSGRSLLSLAQYKGAIAHLWTEQRFIVIIHDYATGQCIYHVHAYELPFSTWSPWWSPGVGLLVTLACWLMFRRRQPLRADGTVQLLSHPG
jgi:hypothetical protein